jgi:hypothetical protein
MQDTGTDRPGREPWPLALAAALAAMIGVCLAFFAVATANPDPPLDLERGGMRPYEGFVARGAAPARSEAR